MTKKRYIEFIEKNLWDFWFTIKKYGTTDTFKELAQNIHEVLLIEFHHTDIIDIDDYLKKYEFVDSQVGKG